MNRTLALVPLLAPLLFAACARPHVDTLTSTMSEVLALDIEARRFIVRKSDGSTATFAELVGSELDANTEGRVIESFIRIEGSADLDSWQANRRLLPVAHVIVGRPRT